MYKVGGVAQTTEFTVLIWYLNSFHLISNRWLSSLMGNKSLSLSSSEPHLNFAEFVHLDIRTDGKT